MNNNGFLIEHYPIVVQVQRVNGKDYAIAYQPDFDYRVMEIYQPKLQSQMASLIFRVQSELKIKIKLREIEGKSLLEPSKAKGSFDLNEQFDLKTKDVARILNVSEMTVVRWTNDGTLSCKKSVKGHRRFKRSDVEKLDPKEKPSPNPAPIIVPFPAETKVSPTPHTQEAVLNSSIYSARFNESFTEV